MPGKWLCQTSSVWSKESTQLFGERTSRSAAGSVTKLNLEAQVWGSSSLEKNKERAFLNTSEFEIIGALRAQMLAM
jgi:hypothetical protein